MKIKSLFILGILVVMFGVVGVYAKNYSTLQEYENSINYSCQTDSDCVIKDVPNCCGYYPKCTNNDAFVDAPFVQEACKNEGLSSICGFPDISYCGCENNKCVGKQREPFHLSNGRNAEIKIMPETASAKAIERLGELNFTMILKEVGNDNVVYELTGNKQGKFLGIFKIMGKVKAQVDAETGNVKVIKPWWNFLASGI